MGINNISEKDLFKKIKKESKEYSDDITEGFPYFCLRIFWDSLSQDDIEDALTGLKTNDDSIDAFFVDEENKEINILQCKSCESEKNLKPLKKEWLAYLDGVVKKLEDNTYIDRHKNEKLKEIAKNFIIYKKKGFKTKLHFYHLGRGDKNILDHYKDITYYDLGKIKEQYLEYDSKRDRTEPPEIELQLEFDGIEPDISNKKHRTFVGIITGNELIRLREVYRYKLFDKNLRFSLGKNKINRGIIETTKDDMSNFYFYNNGITITSKGFKFKTTNNKLKIEYPQIINGAQTVNAIYEAYKERENKNSREKGDDSKEETREKFKELKLLFRVIQDDSKDGKKTSKFEEKVIKYNNSQNTIRETDFYANNREQIKLQEIFAQYGYFYEIKRGDRKYLDDYPKYEHNLLKMKKSDFTYWDDKIDMEKLASLWMAYYVDPTLDKIKKGNIFGYAGDKNYNLIFDTEENLKEETVKEMILAYNLFEIIVEQTEIFSNKNNKGRIINKLSQIDKDNDSYPKIKGSLFDNVKKIIENSLIFNDVVKKKFENKNSFLENRDFVIKQIKKYQFFSMGKYLTLSIFKLVLDKCEYVEQLIKIELFKDKNFIKNNIVAKWLSIILDGLMKIEYEDFSDKIGSTVGSFYGRNQTFEQIKDRFNILDMEKNKEYKELFPLKIN